MIFIRFTIVLFSVIPSPKMLLIFLHFTAYVWAILVHLKYNIYSFLKQDKKIRKMDENKNFKTEKKKKTTKK